MDQVEKFDELIKKYEDYQFLMNKFIRYIFVGIGCILMVIPIQDMKEDGFTTTIIVLTLLGSSVLFKLQPYMKFQENGKQISIYEKLKWMPISKTDIFKVRLKYLSKYCIKIEIIIMLLQQIGALINKNWGIANILYPLIIMIVLLFIGISDIGYGK